MSRGYNRGGYKHNCADVTFKSNWRYTAPGVKGLPRGTKFLRELYCKQASIFILWGNYFLWLQKKHWFFLLVACVAGVRRGVKGERRAREAREGRTREDRVPSPSRAHFDFPPFLRPVTHAILLGYNFAREFRKVAFYRRAHAFD